MRNKQFVLMFMFVLVMPLAFAAAPTLNSCFKDQDGSGNTISNSSEDFIMYDNCEGSEYNSTIWKSNGASYTVSGGKCRGKGTAYTDYSQSIPYITLNQTAEFIMTVSGTTALQSSFVGVTNTSPTVNPYAGMGTNVNAIYFTDFGNDAHIDLLTAKDGNGEFNDVIATDFQNVITNLVYNMTIHVNASGDICGWANGTLLSCMDIADSTFDQYQLHMSQTVNVEMQMDDIRLYNGTSCPIVAAQASDTTSPIINGTINNTSPKINEYINYSFNITDETALSTGNITINLSTGIVYMNYSLSGTSATISNTTQINCARGCVLNITGYATDTSNNVKQNSTIITVADTLSTILIGINTSTMYKNTVLNISGNSTDDDKQFSIGVVSINTTGNPQENYSFTPTSGYSRFNFSLAYTNTLSRGNVLNFTVFINDSYGTMVQASQKFTIADTLGTIKIGINNTSPKINENINISGNCTDIDADFSLGTLSYNISGNPQTNFSFAPDSGISLFNFSKLVTNTLSKNNVLNFTIFCNDTVSTQYQASSLLTISDTLGTINIGINNTSPKINEIVNISGNFTDADMNTANCYISYNMSGNPQTNVTFGNTNCSTAVTISIGRANVINFTAFYNDTYGTTTQASSLVTVQNTNPATPSIVNVSGRAYNKNQTINWTATDADSDQLLFTVYFNGALFNTLDYNFTTNMVNDGMYFLNISSSDGLANSTNATFNISLDTVIPIISCNISNNTFARLNKTLQCDLSDSNPYNFTFRIWKSTSEYHLAINSSLDLANPTLLRIIRNINVTEDGNYTIELNGSDSVTRSPKIDKLSKSKKSETKFVLNDTLQAAFGDFTLLFYDKNGNGASASSVKSYSNYNEKGTRIHFGANFTAGDNNIIPTYDLLASKNIDIYTASGIKGHLIWFPYGTEFEGTLKVNGNITPYSVEVIRVSGNNVRVKIISSIDIKKDDIVEMYFDSVFGLNQVNIYQNLVYDFTFPSLGQFNISGFLNNSFTNKLFFNVTVNATETYSEKAQLYVNDLINLTASYPNNDFVNITNVQIYADGNYTFKVKVNDTAGNERNFSYFYNIVVDTTNPVFVSFNLTNNTFSKNSNFNLTNNNVTDLYTEEVVLFVDNIKNQTLDYNSATLFSFTLNLTNKNYTIKMQANDTARNTVNSSEKTLVIDTIAPTFTTAYYKTTSDNFTIVYPGTSVNLTIIGLDDLYINRGNFTQNCTNPGLPQNISMSIHGNQTSYTQFLNGTNFTTGQICGWGFDVFDTAGNQLTSSYTFSITESPPAPYRGDSSSGSGLSSSSLSNPTQIISDGKVNCNLFYTPQSITLNENDNSATLTIQNNVQINMKPTISLSESVKPYIKIQNNDVTLFYTSLYNYTIERKSFVNGAATGEIIVTGDVCKDKIIVPIEVKKKYGNSFWGNNRINLGNFGISFSNIVDAAKSFFGQTIVEVQNPFTAFSISNSISTNNNLIPIKMWAVELFITVVSLLTIPFISGTAFLKSGLFMLFQAIALGGSLLLKYLIK